MRDGIVSSSCHAVSALRGMSSRARDEAGGVLAQEVEACQTVRRLQEARYPSRR